jgi:hypothetical protein
MKLRLGLLLSLCLLAIAGCNTRTTTSPTSDIIARYPFDGNLLDSSGHHHNAIARGNVRYGYDAAGRSGKALILNGHAILTVADSPDLHFTPTSSFSIYTWIKTADTGDVGIFCKGPASNAVPGYRLELKGGHPRAEITASGTNVNLIGSKSLADNKWHLVTMTVKSDTVNLYLDTTLVGQQLHAHLRPDSAMGTNPLIIGGKPNGGGGLRAKIDGTVFTGRFMNRQDIIVKWSGISGNVTMADLPPGEVDLSTGSTLLGITWITNTTAVRCGNVGLLERTVDQGVNWTSVTYSTGGSVPLPLEHLFAVANYGNNCVAVGYGSTYFYTSDPNLPWTTAQLDLNQLAVDLGIASLGTDDVHLYAVKYLTATKAIAVGSVHDASGWSGIVLEFNSANATWVALAFNGTAKTLGLRPLYSIGVDNANHRYYVGGRAGSLFECASDVTWATANWSNVVLGTPHDDITGCDFAATGDGTLVTTDGKIYTRSSNVSWVAGPQQNGALFSVLTLSSSEFWVGGDGVLGHHVGTSWATPQFVTNNPPPSTEFWLWGGKRPDGKVSLLGYPTTGNTYWWMQ